MNRRDLQNEKRQRVERELLRAGKISDESIEDIIGTPQLYERIREKIAAEKSRRQPADQKIPALVSFQFWNWRRAGPALTALTVLTLGAAAFFMRVSPPAEMVRQTPAEKIPAPVSSAGEVEPAAPQIPEPPKIEVLPRKIVLAKKASSKLDAPIRLKPARKTKTAPPRVQRQPEEPFFALTSAVDFEAGEERRIVRVELPPAQLLALGVAVQTENESEKIKTDLLVGADGVARAIRVVK